MDSIFASASECAAENGCSIPFYRLRWHVLSDILRNRSVDAAATHADSFRVHAIDFVGGKSVAALRKENR